MTEHVRLARGSQGLAVEPSSSIICQTPSSERTTSTSNGRKRIREVASTLNDVVFKRLKVIGDDDFVYHMNNKCYKTYTLNKTVQSKYDKNIKPCTHASATSDSTNTRRSSLGPRSGPTVECNIYQQKCVICDSIKHKGTYNKFRISEGPRAHRFLEATCFFQDGVYTRTCDLQDINSVFGADIYCHGPCMKHYLIKYERELNSTGTHLNKRLKEEAWAHVLKDIEDGLSQGHGFELSKVRDDMNEFICSNGMEGASGHVGGSVTNREVKILLINHFGDEIDFSTPKQANKSMMFFKRDIAAKMAENIRNSNPLTQAASTIKDALLNVDFNLNDRFCDAQDLEESWDSTKIPEPLLHFFASLFNFDHKEFYVNDELDQTVGEDDENSVSSKVSNEKRRKMNSLFQIMYYMLHKGSKRTPLHIMNSEAIYDSCKSATLITSFNHFGLCTSYDELMRFQNDLASFTVEASIEAVPFPSHFSKSNFTMAAFDNFDHEEETLSGIGGSHDTVTVLFQDDDGEHRRKPKVSTTCVKHGPRVFNTELSCQNLKEFYRPSHRADLPDSYSVSEKQVDQDEVLKEYKEIDVSWLLGRVDLAELGTEKAFAKTQQMAIWRAANLILCVDNVPLKRIGFLPVSPYPVSRFDTVYSSMKNLQDILKYLDQPCLSVTCDEGVYRVAREIQLIRPQEFHNIVLCLGSFHMTKVALGCLGKYLKSSGAESILIESGTFGVNVVESVLNGRHYTRSFKGLALLKEALSRLQWAEFFKEESNANKHRRTLDIVEQLKASVSKKET